MYDEYLKSKNSYEDRIVIINNGGKFYNTFDVDGVLLSHITGYKVDSKKTIL